jgi:hypothetical protein
MPNVEYRDYIASEAWKHVRDLALEHYGNRCALCAATTQIEVHHRTY